MHSSDSSRSRVQEFLPKTNGIMRPFPDRSWSTSNSALVRMAIKKLNADDDWRVIERIKDSFNGADDSSLGQILKNMVDSTDTDLDQLKSAYLKLNFLARGLKAGLEDLTESDTRDRIAEPNGEAEAAASEDAGGEETAWIKEAEYAFDTSQRSSEGVINDEIRTGSQIVGFPKRYPSIHEQYKSTARMLHKMGYYKGLTMAIECSLRNENTFVIIDCPSGSGKTLAGVALSLLDHRQTPKALIGGAPVAVVHLVWPKAVGLQRIYRDIVKQTGVNQLFFDRASAFDYVALNSIDDATEKEQYVRDNLLDVLFPGMDSALESADAKKNSQKSFLVIIDEIPEDPMGVKLVCEIRDALKLVKNLCLVLSGTNSKASNMIYLSESKGVASSRNDDPSLWAVIVTRLPRFVMDSSFVATKWDEMNQPQFTMLSQILDAIKCSISNGGNPRIIVFAIEAAFEEFQQHKDLLTTSDISESFSKADYFYQWQEAFSDNVLQNKFASTSFTRSFKGLAGQLNLLIEAAATADLSDVLLGHHFAYRAIPDNAATASSKQGAVFRDCGGCLYLARQRDRAVGRSLFFFRGLPSEHDAASEAAAFYSWQTTCFSPPHADVLLYLMACRSQGYFTVTVASAYCVFRAHELVLSSWKSNAAGLLNFQNPKIINSGSLLEVLMSAAVSNAAGRASATHGFVPFLREFGAELGIPLTRVGSIFANDQILSEIQVPKFIFPGQNRLLSKNRYLVSLKGVLGTAERQENDNGFDLVMQAIGSSPTDSVRFEAKDQNKFGTDDLIDATRKLLRGTSNVGVLVLRGCNLYWGSDEVNINNRKTLQEGLKLIPKLGKVYLILGSGFVELLSIHEHASATGRLILFQVPESSVRETLETRRG